MLGGERDDEITMDDVREVGHQDQATGRRAGEGLDGALNVGGVLEGTEHNVDPERRAQGFARTLLRWRLESAVAALRFIDGTIESPDPTEADRRS